VSDLDEAASELGRRLGHAFRDPALLARALTHRSYAYEEQPAEPLDNETLEFLGDSVVGLISADFFYSNYSDRTEGELSKLKSSAANTLALAGLARKIKLDKFILLGKGEEKSGGRKKDKILAGAFEALMGAIYVDGGYEAARRFLLRFLESPFKKMKEERFLINNYKSALQELFQKQNLAAPVYRLVTEKGPDHKKSFVVEVYNQDQPLARAKGRSKKGAEQSAAQKALKHLLGKGMKTLTPGTFILKKR